MSTNIHALSPPAWGQVEHMEHYIFMELFISITTLAAKDSHLKNNCDKSALEFYVERF